MVSKQWAGITAVVFLLVCIVPQILAQQGNPCLRLIRGDNPDSVKVDTCAESNGATGLILFYTKRWFGVVFVSDKYIIPLPYHPADTIIEVTWQSIDTSFHGLRARFDTLEQHFGAFYLRKDYPNDTTAVLGNRYSLRFMNEVNVDTVERFLDQDTMIYCYWRPGGIFLTSVPNDMALQPGTTIDKIVIANPDNFWVPHFHKLGFQWNIWQNRCPMAWEITKGKPSTILCIEDKYIGNEYTHPDLGNYVYHSNVGDGSVLMVQMTSSHANSVATLAMAHGNNDDPTVPGQGMTGICYNCSAVGMHYYSQPLDVFDIDGQQDNILTHPDVINCSYGAEASRFEYSKYKLAMDAGIVVVISSGNSIPYDPDFRFGRNVRIGTKNNYPIYTLYPRAAYPAAFVYTDDSNITKDVKPIAVGATIDGTLYNDNCVNWGLDADGTPPLNIQHEPPPIW